MPENFENRDQEESQEENLSQQEETPEIKEKSKLTFRS